MRSKKRPDVFHPGQSLRLCRQRTKDALQHILRVMLTLRKMKQERVQGAGMLIVQRSQPVVGHHRNDAGTRPFCLSRLQKMQRLSLAGIPPGKKTRTLHRNVGFKRSEEMNKFRRFVTSGVGLTFLVVGATGVLFQFFFKTRPLVQIHAWLGVAMVAVALIHIVQNWRSMLGHLRDWRVYSLVIPAGLAIWYVSQHSHKEGRREMAGRGPRTEEGRGEGNSRREAGEGGNASQERRRGSRDFIAKLSAAHMDGLASAFDKDIAAVVTAMKGAGLQVADNHLTILEIASQNQKAPEEILAYFVPRTRPE